MTTPYVESSALVKLVVDETGNAEVRQALASMERGVTSELTLVETVRAAGRVGGDPGRARARATLLAFDLRRIETDIVQRAATMDPPELRSLDAIHVATALSLGVPDCVFVSYDERALAAAEDAGLATLSP